LTEKWFLRGGVNYQDRKYLLSTKGLIFETDIINGTKSSLQNDVKITSIGIPIDFGYLIQSKNQKINYLIGLGGVINMLLDSKTKAILLHDQIEDEALTEDKNEVNKSTFTIGVFGGIEMKISPKLVLGIEPNFRLTPNIFTSYLFDSKASAFETGVTLRIRMAR
jgi:hypothetical protein